MINGATALQPSIRLQAKGSIMTDDDVARLHEAVKDLRVEIRQLPEKLVSREVWEQWVKGNSLAAKPVCHTRFVELEEEMTLRRLFEVRVYTIAAAISGTIALAGVIINIALEFIN